jgi:hypothetical protein
MSDNHKDNGGAIERAKLSIAPFAKLEDWLLKNNTDTNRTSSTATVIHKDGRSVKIGDKVFQDNALRIPGSCFEGIYKNDDNYKNGDNNNHNNNYGDSLPVVPTVLTGLLEQWPAFSNPGISWSVQDLAARTRNSPSTSSHVPDTPSHEPILVSLDGGPSFARMSMNRGRVTLAEYQHYGEPNGGAVAAANADAAPLYIFDPDILKGYWNSGEKVAKDFSPTPACFCSSNSMDKNDNAIISMEMDTMACINGTQYRPLPPAWLLVGVPRSGTPIHNHPLTVAWNALLVGCKLWACLPPTIIGTDKERLLLLNLNDNEDNDNEEDEAFDLSALEWFEQCNVVNDNDDMIIIVQHPGEVVFVPAGWFHVVLNVGDTTSTAISTSLALRRDLCHGLGWLIQENNNDEDDDDDEGGDDKEFATFWWGHLPCPVKEYVLQQLTTTQAQSQSSNDKDKVNVNNNDNANASRLLEWLQDKI